MAINLSVGYGRSRSGRSPRSPMAEINVTPLVEVMLEPGELRYTDR